MLLNFGFIAAGAWSAAPALALAVPGSAVALGSVLQAQVRGSVQGKEWAPQVVCTYKSSILCLMVSTKQLWILFVATKKGAPSLGLLFRVQELL
jgi:hypothetical protein